MGPFKTLGLLALTFLTSYVSAAPSPSERSSSLENRATCSEIRVHKEWRDLTREEKLSYLDAVLCLMKLPPTDPKRKATSRFEDFQLTHILLTDRVHSVGHFLPWHRHLGTLYETALRQECGYKGPFAFWDWSRDADSKVPMNQSPIFDPVTGFGGDGVPGTYTIPPDPNNEANIIPQIYRGCIGTGPFKDIKIHLGPGKLVTTHCIVRGIDEGWRRGITSANVNNILNTASTYERFRTMVDNFANGHIHGSGHGTVGGEMLNIYSAGADPLFYLHHANLDRVWWKWQMANPSQRLYDISGPTTQGGRDQITLDFMMDFPALGPNITAREVMDASTAPSCFKYAY